MFSRNREVDRSLSGREKWGPWVPACVACGGAELGHLKAFRVCIDALSF